MLTPPRQGRYPISRLRGTLSSLCARERRLIVAVSTSYPTTRLRKPASTATLRAVAYRATTQRGANATGLKARACRCVGLASVRGHR